METVCAAEMHGPAREIDAPRASYRIVEEGEQVAFFCRRDECFVQTQTRDSRRFDCRASPAYGFGQLIVVAAAAMFATIVLITICREDRSFIGGEKEVFNVPFSLIAHDVPVCDTQCERNKRSRADVMVMVTCINSLASRHILAVNWLLTTAEMRHLAAQTSTKLFLANS